MNKGQILTGTKTIRKQNIKQKNFDFGEQGTKPIYFKGTGTSTFSPPGVGGGGGGGGAGIVGRSISQSIFSGRIDLHKYSRCYC